jgi:hypothetical protein
MIRGLVEAIINNKNMTGTILLTILAGIIFFCIIKTVVMREGMCIPGNGNCQATRLIDGMGIEYPLDTDMTTMQSVEPNNPFYTSRMVIPAVSDIAGAKTTENIKNNYLTRANIPYLHYDEDLLNRELLPAPGLLFVGP